LLGDWELNSIVVILGEESGKAEVPNVKLEDGMYQPRPNWMMQARVLTSFNPAVVKQSTPRMKEVAPTIAVEMRRIW